MERALWRALDLWEQNICPGCGMPMSESLWNRKDPARAKYRAGYHECNGCYILELAQIKQAEDDDQARKANKDKQIPTRHRHWFVERDDEKGG